MQPVPPKFLARSHQLGPDGPVRPHLSTLPRGASGPGRPRPWAGCADSTAPVSSGVMAIGVRGKHMARMRQGGRIGVVLLALWGLAGCDDGGSSGSGKDATVIDGSVEVDEGGGLPACSNRLDDDGDLLIDTADPGCTSPEDNDETNVVTTQCSDGVDNDGDGLRDLQDPACRQASDDDESADPPPPQCANGLDDDSDGAIDQVDRGCASIQDDDESDEPALPACQNGVDDDDDGQIDFPRDPGCGSEFDDDEYNEVGPSLPQCGNGTDDDGDGLVDLADPGCQSEGDPREAQQPGDPVPACANALDDDGDNIVDFPLEPGCSAAGDDSEADDPARPPACGNGLDDDADGLTDYPEDAGCAGVGDRDETDPAVTPGCHDGLDNDRDGDIDYPADRGCESAGDATETGACGRGIIPVEINAGEVVVSDSRRGTFEAEGTCGGRGSPEVIYLYRVREPLEALRITTEDAVTAVETALYVRRGCLDGRTEVGCSREPLDDGIAGNTLVIPQPSPGDYYIFVDGATGVGGRFGLLVEEVALAQCLNRRDDDRDGRTDYPSDPGCERATDRDEADPEVPPACSDDEDNDGDGLVDYPLDVGCRSAADQDEVDVCGDGVRFANYPVGEPFVLDDITVDGTNLFQGSCGGANASEKVFLYENPFNAQLTFSVDNPETGDNTVLYVRSACLGAELDCNAGDPRAMTTKGTVTIDQAAPGEYYVFVDARFGLGGPFKLTVGVERLPAGCADSRDNDEDDFIDADDLGCANAEDEDERDPEDGAPRPQCWNQLDDDGDGITDYPFEPGCTGKGDDDEADPRQPPACGNGRDDDMDGVVDFPADIGCAARGDLDEEDPRNRPQCSNRIDDDRDNVTDYPNDPGCAAAGDPSERDDAVPPACNNEEDDDRDGLVDFPYDPGCIAAGHVSERDLDPPAACSNHLDDDGDGIIDFPRDPGCSYAADDDETSPAVPPQCANGMDDDRNGRIDFPDDPGCRFAADTRELTEGPVQPRCSDGVDNDDDGVTDLADVGCINARDNDELDPEVLPFCADGVDNDGNGIIDWPDEPGCSAQGDDCEESGAGLCEGACIDLLSNPLNCGRCGRVCREGIECNQGSCGGEIRQVALMCGNSGRPIEQFIRGPLVEAGLRGQQGCVPNDETQAILVPRGSVAQFTQNLATIRPWMEDGGVVITEYNISDDIYNLVFGANVPQGARNGACTDNILPAFQFTPDDPFWADNVFQAAQAGQTGCGHSVGGFPNVVPIGGWDANNVSIGYVEVGSGRLWLVDIDWQDGQVIPDAGLDLMAYMIANGGGGGAAGPCVDGRDNDGDGLIDAEDDGCVGPADEQEAGPIGGMVPQCHNGRDDDGDGQIDFPFDPGCLAAGDTDERDPAMVPQCANGLDDDGDGDPDYPFDRGCQGRGDADERDPARTPACGNRRDDDADSLIDFPADPGCSSAGDPDEEDDGPLPACANSVDDDRDGITDWPFDPGCLSAADADERDPAQRPQCSNGADDDGDGRTDFPTDPGCTWAADPRENDGAVRPRCSNGVDDDGDRLIDWPADRGCLFAGDDDEVNPQVIAPRCANGVDDDGDGRVDLQDPGCTNNLDDDEVDPPAVPLCANAIDDDGDGLIDWPADPGCQARGDAGEDQQCRMGLQVPLIPANGTVLGATLQAGADNFQNLCGGRDAPDRLYRYVLARPANLTISADNPGTNFGVVLSVRRDCEEPLSQLACAGDFRAPDPTIEIPNAEAGEYYIVVDGGGPERWVGSRRAQIPLPVDPQPFAANNDFQVGCGWADGFGDAFDCYGQFTVNFNGAVSAQLDPTIAAVERNGQAGAYNFRYTSELIGNVWRFRILPAVENDERPVTVVLTGNLGSDGATVNAQRQVPFQGRQLTYLHTSDNFAAPGDPPVYHLMVPSNPDQLANINYAIAVDTPTITARNVTLPLTVYIALHRARDQAGWNAVAAALVQDIEIQAGGGGAGAPRFGNFELSVTEQ